MDPYALPPGEGWTHSFPELGIEFVMKVGEQRHGRRLAVVELTTRAGEEPPEHSHATEDEFFYVLDGEVEFRCGGERFDVTAGGCTLLPRGLPHAYRIPGADAVRLLVITAPAPDDGVRGWRGFFGDCEQHYPLVASPW